MRQIRSYSARYCLIALLSAITIPSFGQYNPFKGANRIFITTDLADKETYLLIAEQLTQEGIAFTVVENGLLIRSEQPTAFTKQPAIFEGKLTVNAGLVSLAGWVRNKAASTMSTTNRVATAAYGKAKNSPEVAGFNYMDTLAKKLQTVLRGVTMYKYQEEI